MQAYSDVNGDSGVVGYEVGIDFITVWFKRSERSYTYSYSSAGQDNVEKMKVLAAAGDGLNSYINRYVKLDYDH